MCSEEVSIKDLKVLEYYVEIISKVSADEVEIQPDGNWNLVHNNPDKSIVDVDQFVKSEPGVSNIPIQTRCVRYNKNQIDTNNYIKVYYDVS